MKVLVIGGEGTVGGAAVKALKKSGLSVLTAGRNSGDIQVDIEQEQSISAMYESLKSDPVDAVVIASGASHKGPIETMRSSDVLKGVKSKMMGQINTVLIGQHYMKASGSFTLTTGILSDEPVNETLVSCVINNGIHGFVIGASPELLRRSIRINVISPGLVEDSVAKLGKAFPGYNPIPMLTVGNAYVKSVLGHQTGQIYRIY